MKLTIEIAEVDVDVDEALEALRWRRRLDAGDALRNPEAEFSPRSPWQDREAALEGLMRALEKAKRG